MNRRHPKVPFEEIELEETFSRSAGPGGQNVNKVSTRVTLCHKPTGITVSSQSERTQAGNRRLARIRLAEVLNNRAKTEAAALIAAREKRRRQTSQRPRAVKRRILESKRRRSEIKVNRRRVQE